MVSPSLRELSTSLEIQKITQAAEESECQLHSYLLQGTADVQGLLEDA